MPLYSYKAMDRTGKELKETLTADSIIQAKSKVKTQGLMLISITEKKAKQGTSPLLNFSKKVKIEELSLMTRQLATLMKAKIQIVEALTALQNQLDNEELRSVISEVKQDVNEGSSLAKAMGKHPKIFNNIYINMVEAGESSGTLEIVLLRLADFSEAQVKLKNKIKGAMMYPVIMIVVGTVLIGILFAVVIPKITKIFKSTGKIVPLPTRITMHISDFILNYWWAIPFVSLGLVYLFLKWKSSPKGERAWHSIVLKIPVIGNLTKMINVSRFCSTLGTLLKSGVPILMAMKIVKNIIPNVLIKETIEEAKESVSEGRAMSPALAESEHFPKMVTHMISLGEKSGELEEMLTIISENYEEQVETKVDGLSSLIEPVMLVFMGIVVSFVVISVIMPMMELNKV